MAEDLAKFAEDLAKFAEKFSEVLAEDLASLGKIGRKNEKNPRTCAWAYMRFPLNPQGEQPSEKMRQSKL